MKESKIQSECKDIAEHSGCLWIRLRPPPAGIPDVLIITPQGRHIWVEFKTPNGPTRALQHRFARDLEARRVLHWFIRDADDFDIRIQRMCGDEFHGSLAA